MSDTWTFDPGYLPGDPRHGLSPRELTRFYLARPVTWLVRCTYGPQGLARREAALPAHIAYYTARRDQIRFVGPILEDDGATPKGSFVMVDCPDRKAAEDFIAGEGFVQAGMIETIEIRRFVETSLTERRQLEMTADPKKQMFLCELIDGPDGARLRQTTGPAHHAYQRRVMDRFIARGPMRSDDGLSVIGTTYIIEVDDRSAAEAFLAGEPMTAAGVFSEVRIDRWRFGNSIDPDRRAGPTLRAAPMDGRTVRS
jgi:hypothetical protein